MYILIQKDDLKSRMWSRALRPYEIDLVALKGSSIKWSLFYIKSNVKYKPKPKAIIFRYLNDYPSLGKTLLRLFSEALTITMAKITRTKIYWICHNVDKETDSHFPHLSKIRRNLLQSSSAGIFVLDEILVPYAIKAFPKSKVDYISFGTFEINNKDHDRIKEINDFIVENKSNRTIFGLCIGSINYKTIHFLEIPKLLQKAKDQGIDLKLIVGGPISEYLRQKHPEIFSFYTESKDIYFVDGFIKYEELDIREISFVFKSNTDLSVPLSYYTAAKASVPIMAIEDTFSAEIVIAYNLGEIVNKDYKNLLHIIEKLNNAKYSFDSFLKKNSWDRAALKLKEHLQNGK